MTVTRKTPRVKKPRRVNLLEDNAETTIWRSLIGCKSLLSEAKQQSHYLAALQLGMRERNALELLGVAKSVLERWRTRYVKWFPTFEKQATRLFEYTHLHKIAGASSRDYKASLALLERHGSTKEDYAAKTEEQKIVVELNFNRGGESGAIEPPTVDAKAVEVRHDSGER